MTEKPVDHCECAERGLPDGWLCGKPECKRTKSAEESLRRIFAQFPDQQKE